MMKRLQALDQGAKSLLITLRHWIYGWPKVRPAVKLHIAATIRAHNKLEE